MKKKLSKGDFVKYLVEDFIKEYKNNKENIEDTLLHFIEEGSIESFEYIFEEDGDITFDVCFSDGTDIDFIVKKNGDLVL